VFFQMDLVKDCYTLELQSTNETEGTCQLLLVVDHIKAEMPSSVVAYVHILLMELQLMLHRISARFVNFHSLHQFQKEEACHHILHRVEELLGFDLRSPLKKMEHRIEAGFVVHHHIDWFAPGSCCANWRSSF